MLYQLSNERAPCGLGRSVGAPPLRSRLGEVTRPAQGLQIRERPRVATAVKRDNVVAFEPAGPATPPAPPPVAVEHRTADGLPPARV